MVIDMVLEFLGNWYRQSPPAPSPQPSPAAVISTLASRQEDLKARLRSAAGPAYHLNVGWLTSPSSTNGWDR